MLGYPWNNVTGQGRDELSVRLSRWLFLRTTRGVCRYQQESPVW